MAHITREIFKNIENAFPNKNIKGWEIEEGEHFNSLIIEFNSRIVFDKITIEKSINEIVEKNNLKNSNYSVYNSNRANFFGIIINYDK